MENLIDTLLEIPGFLIETRAGKIILGAVFASWLAFIGVVVVFNF